ncbi:MAG: hypothetical protein IPL38_02040 [Rhodobacter sp.]|nr:hypothetical protein [Rhodobacter sp.]
MGGQGALFIFAALILCCVVPLIVLAVLRLRRRARAAGLVSRPEAPGALRAALRRAEFWAIGGAVGLIWLNHGILLTYVLTLLADRGAAPALAAAACIGPAQLAGRLALLLAGARVSTSGATLGALGSVVAAGLVLWATGLIFVFAALQGAGAGLLSILRPVLVAEVLGRQGFGTVSGAVAVPAILASAAAPSVGAALLGLGGSGLVHGTCLGMAAAGLALGLWLARRQLSSSRACAFPGRPGCPRRCRARACFPP